MSTTRRKTEHIEICLKKDVNFKKGAGFEKIRLIPDLPDLDFDEIDLRTKFLGKEFSYPLFVCAITGGTKIAKKINRNIAKACQHLGTGMGLGSQRAMLENEKLIDTYFVRDVAPDIFLLGNIGIAQILHYEIEDILDLPKKVEADGLAVHVNPAQEVIQPDGDRNWKGAKTKLRELCKKARYPVIAKEVGFGISAKMAKTLASLGVKAIDIAGAGGTNWAKIEQYRGGRSIPEWGIPTAECLLEVRKSVRLPIIASGGIRSGFDIAKAIAMGADLCGLAKPLLKPALKSWRAVVEHLKNIIEELRIAMFLVNAKNIKELKRAAWTREY